MRRTRWPRVPLSLLLILLAGAQACAPPDEDAVGSDDDAGGRIAAPPEADADPSPDNDADHSPQAEPPLAEGFGRGTVVLTGDGRELEITAFVADTPDLRRRGLMGWEALPDDSGMLFVYDDDARVGFWMKDTLIALSIAFADADGRIHTILDMEPCEADPCPTYRPSESYRWALEVERGYFEELGVEPGWVIRPGPDP